MDGAPRPPIGRGYVLLLGIHGMDTEEGARWLAAKIADLRLFPDDAGKMNLSLRDIGGEVLVVSQFTLFGTVRKGTRPSFHEAAPPEKAKPLYEFFLSTMASVLGRSVSHGEFGADMQVDLVNDGPVTLVIDSPGGSVDAGA